MFNNLQINATFNERTGYGIHGSRFFSALSKLHEENKKITDSGDVHITLMDSVSIQNVTERLPYPSILLNAWESTLQPQWVFDQFNKYFDYLWVVSTWREGST